MNKIKLIITCLLILFIAFLAFNFFKIKKQKEFQQKAVLAQEIRKVLEHLMFDLREARENTILDAPADGMWHKRIAFVRAHEGALEYIVKEGYLWRINSGKTVLIADNIRDLRIRRQKETPDILEVQIEAQKNVSLMTYLKVRIHQ